ncbi:MAG: OprO/OprP family phosphate-selective porin [Gammaproteobacteria bacterium]
MNNFLKYGALAALVGFSGAAMADTAETKDGLTIKTEDGRFEGKLGGRIHFDGNLIDGDENGRSDADISDVFFRRARLTLSGKAYGWEYKFEQDFAGGAPSERDLYIATKFGPGKVYLGQFKHYNGMEEMTSSNEITFMERPYVQANFFGNQQFGMGLGYKGGIGKAGTYAFSVQNSKVDGDGNNSNEDLYTSARLTYAPLLADASVVHLGLSYANENINTERFTGNPPVSAGDTGGAINIQYAGRSVGSVSLLNNYNEATFVGLEAATVQGPFYLQAEYALGKADFLAGNPSQDTAAYYVQASWHVTGESKPYKSGVFKSVKPAKAGGAVELKARYEFAENKDRVDAEVEAFTVGANWYVNPNVRFMLEYISAETKAGLGADEPKVVTARTQFSF